MDDPEYRKFVQNVIDNIKKNGFPQKKVAFPLEQMYEIAEKKGMNLNKVLQTLDEIHIAHEKTPEKIIFFPKKEEPETEPAPSPLDAFANLDPEMLKNMDISGIMGAASQIMQNMSPEQLKSMKDLYENMSEEDKAELIEKAKKMGLF